MTVGLVVPDPWPDLRRFTAARLALGRVGDSLPTAPLLDFELAHARARDAVRAPFRAEEMMATLRAAGHKVHRVRSAVTDRREYLLRPDLGRRLNAIDRAALTALASEAQASKDPVVAAPPDVVFVLADGLSAQAAPRHAPALLESLIPRLEDWRIGPLIVAEQARVALGDEIGEILGARLVVILIGERPGLSSPDSLGAYLTYAPRIGRTDAERNCVSNIRLGGLSYDEAASIVYGLLAGARRLGLSGVGLKDEGSASGSIVSS